MNNEAASLRDWLPSPDYLQDRVILVTGAANGIGKALVKDLAAHGATTVLLDRDVHGLEKAYDDIVAAGHPEPAIYPMDLQGAAPDDYTRLAATLEHEFKQLDGLIHNAAQLGALVPFANFDHELWFNTLQANLNAPYLMTMACLGLLNASKDASIIFTSDAVGRHGNRPGLPITERIVDTGGWHELGLELEHRRVVSGQPVAGDQPQDQGRQHE